MAGDVKYEGFPPATAKPDVHFRVVSQFRIDGVILVLMTFWALFMGLVARQRFGRSFGKWFAIGVTLQFLIFAMFISVSITLSRFDRPPTALFAVVGAAIAMAFMFWRLKGASPTVGPASVSAPGDDRPGRGEEDGALKRWVAQAGVGVWIVAFMVMGFPGGTILIASFLQPSPPRAISP